MADYGPYIREQYTRLSDHDLDIIVNNNYPAAIP